MKIAQVCPRYYPDIGGVEEHVRNISEQLAKKYNVSVFTTDPSGKLPTDEIINGVYVRRFRSWAPNDSYFISPHLREFLTKNLQYCDILHAHNFGALPAFYAAQAKKRNKFIFTPHYIGGGGTLFRNLLHIPYRVMAAKIFQKADKVICVSKYEMKLLRCRFKINPEKLVYIPNGIHLAEFNRLHKVTKEYKTILCVSRLEKYKGVQFLIKALPKLDPNVIVEVVGKGPYKNSLIKLAKKLGVDNRVKFYQDLQREELLQKYAIADLFVLLSEREAMPITIAEALAAKVPCIVSKIPSLLEWIDNENCFGVEYPIKINDMVKLVNTVIGTKIKGVELLDWSDVTSKLEALYNSIL